MDDIQWLSGRLHNIEHSFRCLCTNQGPPRNAQRHRWLTWRASPLREDANDVQTQEYEEQTQARATVLPQKPGLVLPDTDTRNQQPHAPSAWLCEQQVSRR